MYRICDRKLLGVVLRVVCNGAGLCRRVTPGESYDVLATHMEEDETAGGSDNDAAMGAVDCDDLLQPLVLDDAGYEVQTNYASRSHS